MNVLLLLALILFTYGPYVARGGLLRDDLGFVKLPSAFETYPAFQAHLSSFVTMTARPISALLHGASYWLFGATAWAHHATNLALFAASIIIIYFVISRALNPTAAFITSALAAVYPSASGTVFSAMMMNSNLAALFWAAALYLATSRKPSIQSEILATLCLVLSGLSYESFVPLFVAYVAVRASLQPGA